MFLQIIGFQKNTPNSKILNICGRSLQICYIWENLFLMVFGVEIKVIMSGFPNIWTLEKSEDNQGMQQRGGGGAELRKEMVP